MLENVITGILHKPPRILIYGIHGIGKSTLAADAPNPIFIQTEEGANEIEVAKLPTATSHEEVLEQLRALYKEPHEYQTAVIDSADWLEDFIHMELKASYTDKELSYGKDSVRAAEKMSEILTALNHIREKRDMTTILIAHSEIKRFDSPMTEPFDRYQPKLQSRMGSLLQEWADAVLFVIFDTTVAKEEVGFNREVRRGIATGERKIYTEERPAFHAKNRYRMPVQLTMPDVHPFSVIAEHIPYFANREARTAQQRNSSEQEGAGSERKKKATA